MREIDEREARTLLADLIAVDSTNPSLVPGGAGEAAIAAYVLDYLRGLGLETRLDVVAPGRPNVVASTGRLDERQGLMLNGHLDTAGGSAGAATGDGDRVFGLGAADMKGGLVMGLLAVAAVARAGLPLARPVLFAAVVDEEYASIGTEHLVRHYQAGAGVVMEPSALAIGVAHKGFAWASVRTQGRAAHGSDYRGGVDAIAHMGRVLAAMEGLQQGFLQGPGDPLLGHRSIHASLIAGGKELSTYPDHCRLEIERRTLPGETAETVRAELEAMLERLAAGDPLFRAGVELTFSRPPYAVEREEPIVRELAAACRERGREPEYIGFGGWLDSALMAEAGIPTVIFGPDGGDVHAPGEWVSLGSILEGAHILAAVIARCCGAGG